MTDDLQRILGRIEATQELILSELKEQKKRISWLETKVNYAAGAVASVAMVFGLFTNLVLEKLGLK